MSKYFKGSETEKLVLDTWIKFSRAKDRLDRAMRRNVEEQGLTISQFGVLEILYHIGPLSVKDIGDKILLTSSNLVTVIDNLVKRDLVKRVPCPHDRRSVIIHITPGGEALIKPVFQQHLDELLKRFSVLTEEELHQLGSLTKTLGLAQQTISQEDNHEKL